MSHRNYRKMGAPHVVLQLDPDFDPMKSKAFFVDRDGNETEIGGIKALSYEAAIGGDNQWPEIDMVVLGAIRIVADGAVRVEEDAE